MWQKKSLNLQPDGFWGVFLHRTCGDLCTSAAQGFLARNFLNFPSIFQCHSSVCSQVSRCEHHSGSAAVSDLSPRKAELVEDVNLGIVGGNQTPVTPLGPGDIASCDLSQSCSLLRSILKKTPGLELRDSPKVGSVLASRCFGG